MIKYFTIIILLLLLTIFNNINTHPTLINNYNNINLVGELKCYNKSTIDEWIQLNTKPVINRILDILKSKTGLELTLTSIENVKICTDKHGNQQYWIDTFLLEKSCFYNVRVQFNCIKYVNIERSENSGFIIGYPQIDQLISLPEDVNVVSKNVYHNSSNPLKSSKISGLHINSVNLLNSNLVFNYKNSDKSPAGSVISGYYPYLGKINKNGKQPHSKIGNDWIDIAPKNLKRVFPCREINTTKWNSKGLYESTSPNNKCYGINWATSKRPVQAQTWVNLWQHDWVKSDVDWLFRPSETQNQGNFTAALYG